MPNETDADIVCLKESGNVVCEIKVNNFTSDSLERAFLSMHSEPGLVISDKNVHLELTDENLAQAKMLLSQIVEKKISETFAENFLVVVNDLKSFHRYGAGSIFELDDALDTGILVSFNSHSKKLQKFLRNCAEYRNELENARVLIQELGEGARDLVTKGNLSSDSISRQTDAADKEVISWQITTYFGTLTGIFVMKSLSKQTMVASFEINFSSDKQGDSEYLFQNMRLPPPGMEEVRKCPLSTICKLSVGGHPIGSPKSFVPLPIGGDSKCNKQEESSKNAYRIWLALPLEYSTPLKVSSPDFLRFSMTIKSWLRRACHSSLRHINLYLRRDTLKRSFNYLHWLRCGFHRIKGNRNLTIDSVPIFQGVRSL